MTDRRSGKTAGYGRSERMIFTVGNGATGAAVNPVDLLRGYSFIVVRCDDCSNIPASTTLSFQAADDTDDNLVDLWTADLANKLVSGTLPTSGSFRAVINAAGFIQRLRAVFSQNVTGDVVLYIYGFDPTTAVKAGLPVI